jgi:hypothetical protein
MSVQLGIEHFSRVTVSVYLRSALMTSPSRAFNTLFVIRNYVHEANKGYAHARTRAKTTGKNNQLFTSNPGLMNTTDSSVYRMKA